MLEHLLYLVIAYVRGGQFAACGPHVARHSVFSGPQKHPGEMIKPEISSNFASFLLEEHFLNLRSRSFFKVHKDFNVTIRSTCHFSSNRKIWSSQWICFSEQLSCCVYRGLLHAIHSIRATNSNVAICCKICLAMYASELATWRADTSFRRQNTVVHESVSFYHPQSCTSIVDIRGEVKHKRYIACVSWRICSFLFWNTCSLWYQQVIVVKLQPAMLPEVFANNTYDVAREIAKQKTSHDWRNASLLKITCWNLFV